MEGLERIVKRASVLRRSGGRLLQAGLRLREERAFRSRANISSTKAMPADQFYLLRHGRVALEVAAPGRGAITFQTLARAKSSASPG